MRISLRNETPAARKRSKRNIKILWATYHAINISNDVNDIARVVHTSPKKIELWRKDPAWDKACEFWNDRIKPRERSPSQREKRDLKRAERLWGIMIHRGFDLFPSQLETHPRMKKYLHPIENMTRQGVEVLTPFNRIRDWIRTAPTRLKYWAWGLYVWLFL